MSAEDLPYRLVRRPVAPTGPVEPDPHQRQVVAHTGGPLLVLGGPGTGKTSTLVEAVAARVQEGTDPQRVLVLTFGRRGATALRRRIEHRITAGAAVPAPLVRTFHAYAFGLLRQVAAQRGEPPPRLLTGPEQDAVIRDLLTGAPERWPERLRAALPTRAFAAQVRDLLLRAAERGIDDARLADYADRAGRDDWRAVAAFRAEYEAVLALRDATGRTGTGYDYAELVRAAAALLAAEPAMLADERRRLTAVYVDEYADTDPAQRELLRLVAGDGVPLVAFADPDSATFGFRGGDPTGVREFPETFRAVDGSPAGTVTFTRCYRHGAGLLAPATRVAQRLRGPAGHRWRVPATGPGEGPAGGGPVGGPAVGDGTRPGRVEVRTFRSPVTEHNWLAHRLRELHLRERVPWSQMAVLVRAGDQLARVERALRAAEIPTVTRAGDLPLAAQPAVAPLLSLLRCAVDPDRLDEPTAVALLHSPLGGADPFTERQLRQGLRALAQAAGDSRPSGQLLVDALRDPAELAMVDRRWAAPAKSVCALLHTARRALAGEATVEQVVWEVWQASGLAERWYAELRRGPADQRAEAADRDLDAVLVLFEVAARFTDRLPGASLAVFLDQLAGQQVPQDTLAPTGQRDDAVRLLTAHAAKGLEWQVVALPGVQEGVWPDLRSRGSLLGVEQLVDMHAGRETGPVGQTSALLDEERRLFYVAVTRAGRVLLATATASDAVGEVEPVEEPSRFLRELAGVDPSPTGGDDPSPSTGVDHDGRLATAGDGAAGPTAGSGDRPAPAAGPAPVRVPAQPGGQERAVPDGPDSLPGPDRAPPRWLTLPNLVAELRVAAADRSRPVHDRRAAAAQLARLAAAGVRGAHPDQWWGLAPLSDDRPLVDPGEPVQVSPSAMESALRCALRWLLERHGGASPATAAQGVGNLVHAAAMLVDRASVDRSELLAWLDARFDAIEHAARWLAGPEHDRAERMVDKLLRWVAGNPRRLLAIERDFAVRIGQVELRGRVDRLETDGQGRPVVIDLKTGRQAPAERDIADHPQLGAYQAAVAAGAFPEHGTEPGGAALVQLGTDAREAREQEQPALADRDDPQWAQALVRRTGQVMAGSTFQAVRNDRCHTCPVRTSCPVSGHGRQVVEP